MNRSIYSVVLSDEVVSKLDAIAYAQSMSRSGLINSILADYVSYTTPEQQFRDVFRQIEASLTANEAFQALLAPTDTLFSLRSALAFKYNPSIKYSIELFRNALPEIGELRVSIRSKNAMLLLYMLQFFKLWARLECEQFIDTGYRIEDGRFVRRLKIRGAEALSAEQTGKQIAEYVNVLDCGIKAFFARLDDPQAATVAVTRVFAEYVRSNSVTV